MEVDKLGKKEIKQNYIQDTPMLQKQVKGPGQWDFDWETHSLPILNQSVI